MTINTDIYCGICNTTCNSHTNNEYTQTAIRVTVTCPECQHRIQELEEQIDVLKDEMYELISRDD